MNVHLALTQLEQDRRRAVLVTVVEKKGHGPAMPGAKMLVYPDGSIDGTVGGGAIEKAAVHQALSRLDSRENGLVSYNLDDDNHLVDATETGMICGGTTTLFFEVLGPDVRLTVFGGGHIGRELDHLGNRLGFAVTVADIRKDVLDGIVSGKVVHLEQYSSCGTACPNEPDGYVVIATHSHALDQVVLEQVLAQPVQPRYIGVVASIKKARQMVTEIREKYPDIRLTHLHMPVGLNIGGPSPTEIAVSILSEIQSVRFERDGQNHMGPRW